MNSPRELFIQFANKIPSENINPDDDQILDWIGEKFIDNNENLRMVKSNITSRSANFTDVIGDGTDDEGKYALIRQGFDQADPNKFVMMKIQVGQDKAAALKATYLVPISHSNKAMMMRRNFYLSDHDVEESDILSFDYCTFDKRKVIVDPNDRLTAFYGIDYYGEAKMSILRMVMEIQRRDRGGLGLHAGSKTYHVKNNGDVVKRGAIIFGLSGTGKTTLTTHDHDFEDPEKVDILQDDIVLITKDGNVYGTEKGMYVKCSDVPVHPLITKAVRHREGSVIENVHVDPDGVIDWDNYNHTHNSRAIVPRENVDGAAEDIDLPSLDIVLFNTRRPELPPIGRMTSAAQSAAYYALGESIVTSAETKDPEIVGSSKRVVGFDPFILGEEYQNINRIREILENKPGVQCFVVNTGYVGEEDNNISVEDTLACIEGALKGTIQWEYDEDLKYEVPVDIDGVDTERLDPRRYYSDEKYKEIMQNLRKERREHLSQYDGIDKEILDSL